MPTLLVPRDQVEAVLTERIRSGEELLVKAEIVERTTGHSDWIELYERWKEGTLVELKAVYEGGGIPREFEGATFTTKQSTAASNFSSKKRALELGLFRLGTFVDRLTLAIEPQVSALATPPVPSPNRPATSDNPNLDWHQVVEESSEFLRLLKPTEVSDLLGGVPKATLILTRNTPGLEELVIRIQVHGERALPDLNWRFDLGSRKERQYARGAVGKLRREARRRLVEQEHSGGPFALDSLHPLVWTPEVQDQWRAGKRRLALQAAAESVEAELQRRDGSELPGRDINNAWFGDKGNVAFDGYKKGTRNSKSAQQGVRGLGEAAFALVRNLSVHSRAELGWVEAVELLAVLSAYARLVDRATVQPAAREARESKAESG